MSRKRKRQKLTPLSNHELGLRQFLVYVSWWDDCIDGIQATALGSLSHADQARLIAFAEDKNAPPDDVADLPAATALTGLHHYRNCLAQARIIVGNQDPSAHRDVLDSWNDMRRYNWSPERDPTTRGESLILPTILAVASKYNSLPFDESDAITLLTYPNALSFSSVFVSIGERYCAHVFSGEWAGAPVGTVEVVMALIKGPHCESIHSFSVAATSQNTSNEIQAFCNFGLSALGFATCSAERAPDISPFKRSRLQRKLRKNGHFLDMRIPDIYTPIHVGRRQRIDETSRSRSPAQIVQVNWSHRWDRAGHNKLRVLRGQGRMDPELHMRLEKRGGYAFYGPGQRPERKHRRLLAHLGHKQKQRDEWMACKDWFVQSTVCGPSDAPYVPKLRVTP